MNNILINGQPGDQLTVTDRALHYGDGLFETIAVINGIPRLWERHLARLQRGCERLSIPMPDHALLRGEVAQVASNDTACVVKIIVSRGSGGRGYRPPVTVVPTRLIMRYPFPDYPNDRSAEGVEVRLCDMRLGCNSSLAGIKHLNRLEQVLARSEWDDDTIVEGLMLDAGDHLIDGTMSNIFMVMDRELITPDLSHCGVEGVMRSAVIGIAQQNTIPLRIVPFKHTLLEHVQEMFITNALIGIWPVIRCGEYRFPVGPLTRLLQHKLVSLTEISHA